MGDMAATIRSDSETGDPARSQARKALTEPPFPTPGPWVRRVLQALNLARTSREVAWQVVQQAWATLADSRLGGV